MNVKRILAALAVLAVAALSAYGIQRFRSRAPEDKVYLIGMSQANLVEPWRSTTTCG